MIERGAASTGHQNQEKPDATALAVSVSDDQVVRSPYSA
jgi:hypothetical protein